jgi:hypothetical protein
MTVLDLTEDPNWLQGFETTELVPSQGGDATPFAGGSGVSLFPDSLPSGRLMGTNGAVRSADRPGIPRGVGTRGVGPMSIRCSLSFRVERSRAARIIIDAYETAFVLYPDRFDSWAERGVAAVQIHMAGAESYPRQSWLP